MTSKFYIYASQQWRELDVNSGEVTGWRERSEFVYSRQGKLHVARRASVLRGLRDLALGQSGSVRCGSLVSFKRRKPDRHQNKKQSQEKWEPHQSCVWSHSCSCSTDVNKQITVTPQPQTSTGTQSTADVGTQAGRPGARSPDDGKLESGGEDPPVANKRRKLRNFGPHDQDRINLSKSLESKQMDITYKEDKNICRQIIIYDEDVSVFRNFLSNNKTDVDLTKFDNDEAYKTKIFYAINPVVDVERCAVDGRASRDDEVSIEEFAERLGLRSSHIINEPIRFKTRNRVYKKRGVESPSGDEDTNVKDVSVKSKLKVGRNDLTKLNSKPSAMSSNLRLTSTDRSKPTRSLRQTQASRTSSEDSSSSDAQNFKTKPESSRGQRHPGLRQKLLNKSESEFSSTDNSSSSDSKESFEKVRRKSLTRTSTSKFSSSEGSSCSEVEKNSNKNSTAKSARSDHRPVKKPENKRLTRTSTNKNCRDDSHSGSDNESNSYERSKASPAMSHQRVEKPKRLTRTTSNKRLSNNESSTGDKEKNFNTISSNTNSALINEKLRKPEYKRITRETTKTSNNNRSSSTESSRRERENASSDNRGKNRESRKLTRSFYKLVASEESDSNTPSSKSKNSIETARKVATTTNVSKLPNGSSEDKSTTTTGHVRGNDDDMSSGSELETNNTRKPNQIIFEKRNLSVPLTHSKVKETNKSSNVAASEDNKENKVNQTSKQNIRKRVLDKLNQMGSIEVEDRTIEEKNSVRGRNEERGKQKSNEDSDRRSKNIETKKVSGPQFKVPKSSSVRPGREYSSMEDQAIVAWVSMGTRARAVNGNALWKNLQQQYSRITGQARSWHSLRNRYLRYILPALPALALPPQHAARLRAAAAAGTVKSKKKEGAGSSPPRALPALPSAWSRRPARFTLHEENDAEEEPHRARRSPRAAPPPPPPRRRRLYNADAVH